jgi:hypothetical protein
VASSAEGSRQLCVRVVDPSLDPQLPAWGDCAGGWVPPAAAWVSLLAAAGVPFTAGPDSSFDDGEGLLIHFGDGSESADRPTLTIEPPADPEEALRLIAAQLGALVVPDLRGVLLPRLDDPGAAAKRYLGSWRHPDVAQDSWTALWDELEELGGQVSVFCCPGWVHPDGTVGPSRVASPAEWRALDDGVRRQVATLECHGYTHMHPDTQSWCAASDRFDNESWYREFHPPQSASDSPLTVQLGILERWNAALGSGTSVVAPGEAWDSITLTATKRAGFALFNSWSICRLDLAVPVWLGGVGSPYLDQEPDTWAGGPFPVVGYWHDRDMALRGAQWAPQLLRAWRDAGMTRFWSFAQLAAVYADPVDAVIENGEVSVRTAPNVPLRTIGE